MESNRRCSIAVVSLNGKAALFPVEDLPPADLWGAKLSWVTNRQVSLSSKKVTRTIDVP